MKVNMGTTGTALKNQSCHFNTEDGVACTSITTVTVNYGTVHHMSKDYNLGNTMIRSEVLLMELNRKTAVTLCWLDCPED
jgi:hypothetical protein